MTVTAVNHFTVLTDDLPATLAFYEEHLNLKPGARPPFTFPGAWQLFFFDPNDAKVEIDFDKAEAAPADMGEGARSATRTY